MFILRAVLKVKFTKYCACEAGNPEEEGQDSQECTEFSTYHCGVRTPYENWTLMVGEGGGWAKNGPIVWKILLNNKFNGFVDFFCFSLV